MKGTMMKTEKGTILKISAAVLWNFNKKVVNMLNCRELCRTVDMEYAGPFTNLS